eukprot:gene4980-6201_t
MNNQEIIVSPEQVTIEWLQSVLKGHPDFPVLPSGFSFEEKNITGGFSGDLKKILLEYTAEEEVKENVPKSLVLKTIALTEIKLKSSTQLGAAREGVFYKFYNERAKKDDSFKFPFVPTAYYSEGYMDKGSIMILMEDLSKTCCPASHLFGNQIWGEVPIPESLKSVTHLEILETIYKNIAHFHEKYWRDETLLNNSDFTWLKNIEWIQGRNKEQWEFGMDCIKTIWSKAMEKRRDSIKWSEKLLSIMDKLLASSNFERYLSLYDIKKPNTPFTLCHSDFHAGNILYPKHKSESSTHPFYLVDWQEIGVFNPFIDIPQILISNVTTEFRRQHEEHLFRLYWNTLTESGKVSKELFPYEQCFLWYKIGGIDRWLQMLALLVNLIPDNALEYFHEKVASFIDDHYDDIADRFDTFLSCYAIIQ